jgi:hypothetical protein
LRHFFSHFIIGITLQIILFLYLFAPKTMALKNYLLSSSLLVGNLLVLLSWSGKHDTAPLLCDAFTALTPSTTTTTTTTNNLFNDRRHITSSLSTFGKSPSYNSVLFSSFFGKFEEFENDDDDEDEDDDEDDDYDDLDQRSIADFKSKMSTLFDSDQEEGEGSVTSVDDLINFARQKQSGDEEGSADWAKPVKDNPIRPGTILVANPKKFCELSSSSDDDEGNRNLFRIALGEGSTTPSPSLLAKFGLTRPPPKSLGPDRQADLLPVVVIVEADEKAGINGVLLNRRTGYLLGDLEQPPPDDSSPTDNMPPILEKFCIQPLWFGGVDSISTGLDMLHLCPAVKDATQITDDGMYWGGEPAQAQDAMEDPSLDRIYSGFDFKFFVQSTIWSTNDLKKELKAEVWFPAQVSKNVLFKVSWGMGVFVF